MLNPDKPGEFSCDRVTEMDLGEMFLIYNKVLVARSSREVFFFKLEVDEEDETKRVWVNYHTIKKAAFLSYMKGNVRI